MKKYSIMIITILLISIILSSLLVEVHAFGISNPKSYISKHADDTGLKDIGNVIVGIVRALGTAISVLILTIIGIKYIMGSAEEKAQYKQTMWPYIIGAVLIFAGSQVTNIIYMAVTGK